MAAGTIGHCRVSDRGTNWTSPPRFYLIDDNFRPHVEAVHDVAG